MRNTIPAEIRPEQLTAIVDSREQCPLDLSPLRSVVGTLPTGDYSIQGLENHIALERKSLPDLLSGVGQCRERFEREIQRLLAYPCRAVVVEATWADLEGGEWRSQVTPATAVGSVLGWIAQGVPFLLVGSHERAGRYVSRLLFTAARRRWRECRGLILHADDAQGVGAAAGRSARWRPGGENNSVNLPNSPHIDGIAEQGVGAAADCPT